MGFHVGSPEQAVLTRDPRELVAAAAEAQKRKQLAFANPHAVLETAVPADHLKRWSQRARSR